SGKSNFFDALAFMRDAMETNIPEAVRHHGGWSSILFRDSEDRQIAFEVEVGFECGRPFERVGEKFTTVAHVPVAVTSALEGMTFTGIYGFVIEAGANDLPMLASEYLRFPDQGSAAEFGFEVKRGKFSHNWKVTSEPTPAPFAVPPQLKINPYRPDRLLLSVIGNQPFIDVVDGLRFAGFYSFHPDAIRQLQKPAPGAMLERDGKNLASLIESVREIDEASVQRVERYLHAVVNEVEGFSVVRYGDYETVRFRLRPSKPEKTSEFDASSMSDGTIRVLAALMAAFQIHLPSGPTVVGIEEPETALHPAAMRALVAAMDEATLRTQILLTTHSPDLLDAAEVKTANIRVVQMIDGQTVIGPVDEASVSIVRDHLSTLGGLERERQLEPDFDDLERQAELARQERNHQ
ncbi:MAG: AAA family ATPase, partial [Gemmataceae bacterium]